MAEASFQSAGRVDIATGVDDGPFARSSSRSPLAQLNARDARREDYPRPLWPREVPRWLEWLALASLILLACYFLKISWRKWPDPQIDFGRELYIPWRLSLGDVLGRDVEPQYGPLSQYFNAGLFALFGPGLMVLVGANLVIYGAILLSAYWILRQGWGVIGAWAGSVVFVSVFSFSQYVLVGNYNYATPYAHEATHGLLVCLALTAVLVSLLRRSGTGKSAVAGLLFGLTAVLKAEIILAGAVVVATAGLLHWRQHGGRATLRLGWAFAAAALLPSVVFFAYFSRQLPASDALFSTGRAWLNVVATARFTDELVQRQFSGMDQPLRNLTVQASATGVGLAIVASIILGLRLAERGRKPAAPPDWRHWLLAVCAVAIGLVAGEYVHWMKSGRALPGMVAVGLLLNFFQLWPRLGRGQPEGPDPAVRARFLAGTLAIVLMGRMLLNARIEHYGFFQAALAAMLVVAAMVAEWPARFISSRPGRICAALGMLAVVASGIFHLVPASARLLGAKQLAVGSGPDLFYAFPTKTWAPGELVRASAEYLSRIPSNGKILVLPEGVMINYLARRATPTASYRFFASDLAEGREERLVAEMKKNPPDRIILLSRDLREFGIARYGDKTGEGRAILQWIATDYQLSTKAGGDPLNPREAGVAIYRPKSQPPRERH